MYRKSAGTQTRYSSGLLVTKRLISYLQYFIFTRFSSCLPNSIIKLKIRITLLNLWNIVVFVSLDSIISTDQLRFVFISGPVVVKLESKKSYTDYQNQGYKCFKLCELNYPSACSASQSNLASSQFSSFPFFPIYYYLAIFFYNLKLKTISIF